MTGLFLRLVFTTVALLVCHRTPAAEPVTFQIPADGKSENLNVVNAIAFSPDGRLFAAALGTWGASFGDPIPGQVAIWDAKSGQHHATLSGHVDGVSCVAFSTNGKLIATAGHHGEIKLWQTETLRESAGIRVKGRITTLAYSPDDKFLVVGCDNLGLPQKLDDNVELYDIAAGKRVLHFEGHEWGSLFRSSLSPSACSSSLLSQTTLVRNRQAQVVVAALS